MLRGGKGKAERRASWLAAFVVAVFSVLGLAGRAEALTPIPVQATRIVSRSRISARPTKAAATVCRSKRRPGRMASRVV